METLSRDFWEGRNQVSARPIVGVAIGKNKMSKIFP
jgi:hypothetical protein